MRATLLLALLVLMPATASAEVASWYDCVRPGQCSRHKITASGERFRPDGLTAAHRSLPFGTRVRVTNLRTGRAVVVRVNDRGPFVRGRTYDLSRGAARAIGLAGVGPIRAEVLR
ncbi:MAG: septal ring lytic transglycosylase RlpA family protein [Alphaproteobacteria bacterium]|nr:septal ring lytic transglycosylase RlpA family protein [Alphaproteobacteria bacterium]